MALQQSVAEVATRGILWSIAQNWGGRAFTFVLFIVLARFLTPTDFGLASAAALVLMLIAMVAELGFGDAIVQRKDLTAADINLPFFVSVGCSVALAITTIFLSKRIEKWLSVAELSPVLIAVCITAPLSTVSMFQEVNYRRHFAFRQLAFRVFIANLIAGPLAIACALMGGGVWSLVVQSYVTVVVSLIWLWKSPYWVPSLVLEWSKFRQLSRFGISVVSMRLIGFVSLRFVEFIIVARFGVAAFGLYAAGSRIYFTMLYMLQTSLTDVSLAVLSKISDDRERTLNAYEQAITLAATTTSPLFVFTAALSPEICDVLLGSKWNGVSTLAQPLLLLGALQCVQFLNGSYLSARGRPSWVLVTVISKMVAVVLCLSFVPTKDVIGLVTVFVVAQLVEIPFSYWFVARDLQYPLASIFKILAPAFISNAVAFVAVQLMRHLIEGVIPWSLALGAVLGLVYVLVYLTALSLTGRAQINQVKVFVLNRVKGLRPSS
jgi:O-antigen/teichoic acid export membrane protein